MKMSSKNSRPLRRSPYSRRRIRRRRFGFLILVLFLASVAGVAAWGTVSATEDADTERRAATEEADTERRAAAETRRDEEESERPVRREAVPDSPAAAAYRSLVGGLPDASAGDLAFVQRSVSEPSKSAVWFAAPDKGGRERHFVFFTEKVATDEGGWRVYRSVVVGDQGFPRDIEAMLPSVPEDLREPVLRTGQNNSDTSPIESTGTDEPEVAATQAMNAATEGADDWRPVGVEEANGGVRGPDGFYRVGMSRSVAGGETQETQVYLRESGGSLAVSAIGEGLTGAELPGFPKGLVGGRSLPDVEKASFGPTTAVYDGGARDGLTGRGVEDAVEAVEGYPGVAGFYVMDPSDGSGYGVRPDDEFFSASTIKIAVMAAVYKKIESGELAYSDRLVTSDEDWAAGAGWLRWETPGAETTVEDALWLMITESDNVATNVLTRSVGGADYVNSVTRELGARDTELFWKLSSERAAVPALDNHTTPRDMATVLGSIYEGDGFDDFSHDEMVNLMRQNSLEYWLEGGVPAGVTSANKGGWLDGIYNDVGIVEYEGEPYVVAIYTMNGPGMSTGSPVLADISGDIWLAQTGKTKEEFEAEPARDEAENGSNGEDDDEGARTGRGGASGSGDDAPRRERNAD